MGLTDRLFRTTIQRAVEERVRHLEISTAAEATAPQASQYAFEHLSSQQYGAGARTLPQPYIDAVIRDSNWLYESHGLAYIIVSRMISLIFEGGIQYAVAFDKGVPDDAAAQIRKRLDEFFYGEDADLQDRCHEFVLEAMLNGEHGWRLRVDPDNGAVSLGDLPRADVEDLTVDAFDRRKLARVRLKLDTEARLLRRETPESEEERTLNVVAQCRDQERPSHIGHLVGDVLYYRLDTRATKLRGSPVLQRVVDELRAYKRFQVMSTDRIIQRLAVFVEVTLKGKSLDEVEKYAASQPKSIPSGSVWYSNEGVTREFKEGKLEGYEITAILKTLITVIAGSFGMPISWFGFGDGTNRATADSQQEPAAQDSRRTKRGLFGMFEHLMYFVADQVILHGMTSVQPQQLIDVVDAGGNPTRKILRECITITVSPVPLAKEKPEGKALETTAAAMDIISKDDLRASENDGKKLFTPENETALINYALARDGVGIEVAVDAPEDGTADGAV